MVFSHKNCFSIWNRPKNEQNIQTAHKISKAIQKENTYEEFESEFIDDTPDDQLDSKEGNINSNLDKRTSNKPNPQSNYEESEPIYDQENDEDSSLIVQLAESGLKRGTDQRHVGSNFVERSKSRFSDLVQEYFFFASKSHLNSKKVELFSSFDFSKILCFWLKEEPYKPEVFDMLLKKRIEISKFPTEFPKLFFENSQNFSERTKKNIIINIMGSKSLVSQLSLANVKNFLLMVPKKWLEDLNTCRIFLDLYNHHFKHLFEKARDIYELEKFLFIFNWGQIFLSDKRQAAVWREYMSMISQVVDLQKLDSHTIYVYCKTLNYIVSITHLQSNDLSEALRSIQKLLNMRTSFDLFYMRAVVLTLNSILIQEDLGPYREFLPELLAKVEGFDFTIENLANMTLFTLRNFKVLLQEDQELCSSIERSLASIGTSNYRRVSVQDSNTQNKIGNILRDMGYTVSQNELVDIYSVDFFLKPKLILEYHGVGHYYLNNHEDMIHLHQVKVRVLRKLNYYVQVIPYDTWRVLESKQRQEAYLNEILYEPFYKSEKGI